jgi:hypothetical protein
MKAKMITVMSVVLVGLASLLLLAQWAAAMSDTPASPQVALPRPTPTPMIHVLSYQGQLKVNGAPYSGSGYFKFAVVNAAADISYWSNDDTSSGGAEPTGAVPLAVTNGLFNVLLGDSSLPNMTSPLIAEVFGYGDSYLRTWFSSDNLTFARLSPDRRIASAPTAMRSEQAANADLLEGQRAGDFWQLTGNAGTDPNTHFVGTTDNKALVLKVNGMHALRLEPDPGSPNVIGGYGGNTASPGLAGSTIGGGGSSGYTNTVTADFATVGGGRSNTASGANATVGGGISNTAGAPSATVGGGAWNIAGGSFSGIPGGQLNRADGDWSLAAGRRAKALHQGAFVWADSTDANFVSTANDQFAVRATGGVHFNTEGSSITTDGNAVLLGEASPVSTGYITTSLDVPYSVYVSGKYAYVASYGNDRLAIFDVSKPDRIVARGYTSDNLQEPRSVHVCGQYAYVASALNDRLAIFDVSDPDNIVARGYTSASLSRPVSVYVSGKYAYVASTGNHCLAIFDISNPDNIVARGYSSAGLSRPRSVYVSGKYAYVASADNDCLAIFDVSDPDSIVARGYTSDNLDDPWSVYVSGNHAYVASTGADRLAIFDVSDPDSIVARGYASANLDAPRSVHVCGQYAYVASAGNDRLAIFDVSDADNIVARGYASANLDFPGAVYVSGQYAYVACLINNRLAVFELNHLKSPTLETGNLQSGYLDVTDNAIVGNNLYVQGGLNVGPGGALIASDLGVEGHLQVHGEYIQFPTISGGPPPAADCDDASEYGRVVIRTDGTVNLYVCTDTGWHGK